MEKIPRTESNVNEEDFIISISDANSHCVLIYGEYDDTIILWGHGDLLTKEVYSAFLLQDDVLDIYLSSPRKWHLTLREGSNFFELDFSELNKRIYGIEHSQFRW